MIEQIYEPPVKTDWFQKELDAICSGRGVQLRIAWAPRLYVAKVVDRDGREREYAKYPVLFGDFGSYIRGRFYYRVVENNLVAIAYQKVSDSVIPPNVLLTDIAIPDIVNVNPSIHLFVIEKQLPDEFARKTHEEKRRLARANLGFDLFKDFPREGIWDCIGEISEHRNVEVNGVRTSCCEMAASYGVRCQGLYREPGEEDLERVKEALRQWESLPNLADKMPLIEQEARNITAAIQAYEDKEITEILKEARECEGLDKIAQERTRVVLGSNAPLHRTNY